MEYPWLFYPETKSKNGFEKRRREKNSHLIPSGLI